MTPDSPLGEYLELIPKEADASDSQSQGKIGHPAVPVKSSAAPGIQATPNAGASMTSREPRVDLSPTAAHAKVKVLRPAQVESWQLSSFDLLSGLQVRDVTDTIPRRVFDELFRTIPATVFTKRRY
jgi:hypothetical protein